MVKNMNYEHMAQMDFCELIVERIKEGAKKWQKHGTLDQESKNKKHLNGLVQGLAIMYLGSPAAANRHQRNAEDCQDNGQTIITASKPSQRE